MEICTVNCSDSINVAAAELFLKNLDAANVTGKNKQILKHVGITFVNQNK